MLLPMFLGIWLGPADDESSYYYMKIMIVFPGIDALAHFLLFIFVFKNRTPRYLISEKKFEEAKRSLSDIYDH